MRRGAAHTGEGTVRKASRRRVDGTHEIGDGRAVRQATTGQGHAHPRQTPHGTSGGRHRHRQGIGASRVVAGVGVSRTQEAGTDHPGRTIGGVAQSQRTGGGYICADTRTTKTRREATGKDDGQRGDTNRGEEQVGRGAGRRGINGEVGVGRWFMRRDGGGRGEEGGGMGEKGAEKGAEEENRGKGRTGWGKEGRRRGRAETGQQGGRTREGGRSRVGRGFAQGLAAGGASDLTSRVLSPHRRCWPTALTARAGRTRASTSIT